MDYNDSFIKGAESVLEYILKYRFGLDSYIKDIKSLSWGWNKIIPQNKKIKDLIKYLEVKNELNKAEESLRNGSHKADARYEVEEQANRARKKLNEIESFETESEAIGLLCDYLIEIVNTKKNNHD